MKRPKELPNSVPNTIFNILLQADEQNSYCDYRWEYKMELSNFSKFSYFKIQSSYRNAIKQIFNRISRMVLCKLGNALCKQCDTFLFGCEWN